VTPHSLTGNIVVTDSSMGFTAYIIYNANFELLLTVTPRSTALEKDWIACVSTKLFYCQNQKKICDNAVIKDPTHLKCVATLRCKMSSVLKVTILTDFQYFTYYFFCLCLVTSSLMSLAFGQCCSKVLFIY